MEISFSLEGLARETGCAVKGNGSLRVTGIAPLDSAREGDLSFVTNPRYAREAHLTRASAILCQAEIPGLSKPYLLSPNPYAALAKIIPLFFPPAPSKPGIREGAWVDPSASVHPEACVSEGAIVSEGARVGARTLLYHGVFIGRAATVGEDCLFYPNVVVRENCAVGNRVILQPGAVVGSDGFGFAKEGETYRKIPQVGNVVLEDDVELGANVCVDRAVLGTTRIGKGTKLDNLIQVGHNVVIGQNTVIAALSGISGSTHVGDQVVMGGQVGLAGHLRIGDKVTLATRSGVMEDIPEEGVYWGSPSAPMGQEMRNVAVYRKLAEWSKRVRDLEKIVEELRTAGKHE